jgi:restriction endonuclease S subunit
MIPIGDVVNIESGSREKGGAFEDGIPSIGGEQIDGNGNIRFDKMKYISKDHFSAMKKGILRQGDTLVVKDGATTGKTGYFPYDFPAAVNEHVFLFRAKDRIDPYFLYNCVKSESFIYKLQPYIKGIIGGINLEIQNIKIPVPPLETQKEIVAEIESYQKVIDGARAVVDNYRPHIQIDPDWPMVELGEICEIISGGNPSRSEASYWNGDIPWIGSTACKDDEIMNSKEFITKEGLQNSSAKLLPKDTTLIALVGATIGRTGYLKFESTTNQNIAGLYPKSLEILEPKFLFYASQLLYPEFLKIGEGKFRMANLSFLREQKIPLPPLSIQQTIINEIETEWQIVNANKNLINLFKEKIRLVIERIWHARN